MIERFLGTDAATGGPLAVLGLPRATVTDAHVLEARDRRIAELVKHPLAHTPEADEVRLAVHAAAANLLDPRVRASLSGSEAARTPAAAQAPAPAPATRTPPDCAFERDALITLGMHGGWGTATRRRIALLAHWHRLPPRAAIALVARLGTARHPKASTHAARPTPGFTPRSSPEPEPDQIDDVWRIAAGAGAAMFVSAIILSVLVIVIIRADAPAPETHDTGSTNVIPAQPISQQSAADAFIPEPRADLDAANVIAHEIRAAASAASAGRSDAMARFKSAARTLAASWAELRRDDVQDANEAVIRFISSSDSVGDGAITYVLATASRPDADLNTRLWADGIAALASGSPALTRGARTRLAAYFDTLGRTPDTPTFAAGVAGGMQTRLTSINPSDEAAWSDWVSALNAIGLESTAQGDDLALNAIDHLMRHPDAPTNSTLEHLVGVVSWRSGSASRRWLLTKFDAADVRTDRLAPLLDAIARSSAAPDILPGMTLDPDATRPERIALGKVYADAWQIARQDGLSDELAAAVRDELAAAVADAEMSGDHVRQMRRLTQLVRANALAARLHTGDTEPVAEELQLGLDRLDETRRVAQSSSFDVNAPITGDGDWGAATLSIDDNDEQAFINAASSIGALEGPIGPADAGVLVRLAFRGSGVGVREAAARALTRHAESPHALLATLDMLDSIPRNETNGSTIETLTRRVVWTGSRDDFFANARRALLERILELIAGGTPEAAIDRDASLIDRYTNWAATGESIDTDAPAAHHSVALLRRKLVSPTSRDHDALTEIPGLAGELVSNRSPRRSLARSAVDRYIAEQRTLAATLAVSVIHADPDRVPRVRHVWQVLERQDAAAPDPLTQAIATERAIAILWQIQLDQGGAP